MELKEFDLLVEQLRDGGLEASGQAELVEAMEADQGLQARFARQMSLTAMLHLQAGQSSDAKEVLTFQNQPPQKKHWGRLAIAATVLLGLFLFFQYQQPATVATLVSSEDAAWESVLPTTEGSKLPKGVMTLKTGVSTIRFESGAEVVFGAPAKFEMIGPMECKLLEGAMTVAVPDSARGFTVGTKYGIGVDYGTKFAVRVDRESQFSEFELIEGEIVVRHANSSKELRLKNAGEMAVAADDSLEMIEVEEELPEVPPVHSESVHRISTVRADSVLRNNKRNKFIHPDLLSVSRTNTGRWDHRSFFAFDLSGLEIKSVSTALLRLNLVGGRGEPSGLPRENLFGVYGLTNREKENWKPGGMWEDSPAQEDGILLGTFDIPRSKESGSFVIQGKALLDFLKEQAGGEVTFILIRETPKLLNSGRGITHLFASASHPEAVGPTLEFTFTQEP